MKPDFVFEVSWEVCNKVGGIYTVLQTKARHMVSHYGENYVLVGPFFTLEKLKGEFEESAIPEQFRENCKVLAGEGIKAHWGKWLASGSPNVILVDFSEYLKNTDDIKRKLWELYEIDSLNAPDDFNHPLVWAFACGRVIELLSEVTRQKHIVSHFHEWLGATGLLYLKSRDTKVKTVFTTHATVLGRSLAAAGVDFYEHIEKVDPLKEAYRFGIAAKHLTEKAAAKNAHLLTTVSEVTAQEVEHFLGRKPDLLLPNGLDLAKYPTIEEIALKHRVHRDRMREFLLYYFLPYYEIDISHTLFYFMSGRYEVSNKGIDIFIKALGKLNERLKKEKKERTIIAFLWIPAQVRGIVPEVIENRERFSDIKRLLLEVHDVLLDNVMYGAIAGKLFTPDFLFGDERARALDIKIKKLKRSGTPPLLTHDLVNQDDQILSLIRQHQLKNGKEDKVKIIYYPTYISGGDGLLNLDYEEVLTGAHFGIFPSLYEPWGYTPLETAALGVASLTTDTAGFGQFVKAILEKLPSKTRFPGIYLLERLGKSEDEIVEELTRIMLEYAKLSREERVENKIAAHKMAEHADWKELAAFYFEAHEKALEK
ncbi:MAG: glycogen/starch synthase [Candidatus Portnoybacteria bacterium]|nr:glycogen/starch synthase [Candidatus Portnoybacteria bacterium]